MSEILFSEDIFDAIKEDMEQVKELHHEEEKYHSEKEKEKQKEDSILPKVKAVRSTLGNREKSRFMKVFQNFFDGSLKKLNDISKLNEFREKMTTAVKNKIKEKAIAAAETVKDKAIDAFKFAIKSFLSLGAMYLVWKSGIIQKINFGAIVVGFKDAAMWCFNNVPILIEKLPSRLLATFNLLFQSIGNEKVRNNLSEEIMGVISSQIDWVFRYSLPSLLDTISTYLYVLGFALDVIGDAIVGAQIGGYIAGLITAPVGGAGAIIGAPLGAVIGAVIGVVEGIYNIVSDVLEAKKQAKVQTQEMDQISLEKLAVYQVKTIKAKKTIEQFKNTNKTPIDIKNVKKVLQDVKKAKDEAEKQWHLNEQYRQLFTSIHGKEYILAYQLLQMFGYTDEELEDFLEILTTSEKFGDIRRDVHRVNKLFGIQFDGKNPEIIINELKRVIEKQLSARTQGTVMEGKSFEELLAFIQKPRQTMTDEEKHAIDTLVRRNFEKEQNKRDKSQKTLNYNNQIGYLIKAGKILTNDKPDVKSLKETYNANDATTDAKKLMEATSSYEQLEQMAREEGVFEEEKKLEEIKRLQDEYKRLMEDESVEKVISFLGAPDEAKTTINNFLDQLLQYVIPLFTNMGKAVAETASLFLEKMSNQTATFSYTSEDVNFVKENENVMLNKIFITVSDKTNERRYLSYFLAYNATIKIFKEAIQTLSTNTKLILDFVKVLSTATGNIEAKTVDAKQPENGKAKEIGDEVVKVSQNNKIKNLTDMKKFQNLFKVNAPKPSVLVKSLFEAYNHHDSVTKEITNHKTTEKKVAKVQILPKKQPQEESNLVFRKITNSEPPHLKRVLTDDASPNSKGSITTNQVLDFFEEPERTSKIQQVVIHRFLKGDNLVIRDNILVNNIKTRSKHMDEVYTLFQEETEALTQSDDMKFNPSTESQIAVRKQMLADNEITEKSKKISPNFQEHSDILVAHAYEKIKTQQMKEEEAKEERNFRKYNPVYKVITLPEVRIVSNHTSEEISDSISSHPGSDSNNGEGFYQVFRDA